MFNYFVLAETANSNVGTMIFVSTSMLLLLLCLKKFAWAPLTKMMQERENKISSDIDSAEQSKIEAERLRLEREDKLKNSKTEAVTIVKEAKETAEQSKHAILLAAKGEAVQFKERAKIDIENQKEQAFNSIKSDVADLSVQIAAKILGQELSKENHEMLINSYIEGLGKQHETR